jgi:hypothetical protein
VLHEQDYPVILAAIKENDSRPEVEGLIFDYIHFYGSFHVFQHSRSVYRREVRIIRNSASAKSVGDAQSFRKADGSKLVVAHSHARVFHYGWVRPPEVMREKTFCFDQLYHGSPSPASLRDQIPHTGDNYRYKRFWGLRKYQGTHPRVMAERIQNQDWNWNLENSPFEFQLGDLKKCILDTIEKWTGYRLFEYRSYTLLKRKNSRA